MLLTQIVEVVRKSNSKAVINWFEGNHEARLTKYLIRNANQVMLLSVEGQEIATIPFLFELKKLNVNYIDMITDFKIAGVTIEHGEIVRKKSGYTASNMLDMRGTSGISGHTHRQAYISKTTTETRFWIENGCMCNLQPTPSYVKSPDWSQGFTVAFENGELHPFIVPIINNSFFFNYKYYNGN